ncbi:Uncharacterised protein [Vibrio cholerae]|nr:Uncharacterised protein [Vibrio cholerae]
MRDHVADVICAHQFITQFVNDFTLIVRYVIVFQQLFTNVEVTAFYFTLRFFNRAREHF